MSGIYLHIPFCKRKCHYCNFYSLASLKHKEGFLNALAKEINSRHDYLQSRKCRSIYFGGGTPSLLNPEEIERILNDVQRCFSFSEDPEITMEVNPDDVTPEKLKEWKAMGFNRISLGVQSFFDEDLVYLNRIHNSRQSAVSSQQIFDAGFTNVSADLIFGMPTLTNEHLFENIKKLADLGIPHISSYALTVEPKTALETLIREKKIKSPDETRIVGQFRLTMETLKSLGYNHYEISNFCRENYYSKHNTMYWSGEHYIGLGPSAHSYNGISRQGNVANISEYIEKVSNNERHFESETLSVIQKYNEYVMTSLRTMWGCDLGKIGREFGEEFAVASRQSAVKFIDSGEMIEKDRVLYLTDKGKLFADGIAAEMFMEEDDK
jgi:oxygen-independent coproporphyrinogen-3 oxidase